MKNIVGMTNEDMSARFAEWNKGELKSYLIEITADILKKKVRRSSSLEASVAESCRF